MNIKNMGTDGLMSLHDKVLTELTTRRDRINQVIEHSNGKDTKVVTVPLESSPKNGKNGKRFIITTKMLRAFAKLRREGHSCPEIVKSGVLPGFKLKSASYWVDKAKRLNLA